MKKPIYQLTLQQFGWLYPDSLCAAHFKEVKAALLMDLETYDTVFTEYPVLKQLMERRSKK